METPCQRLHAALERLPLLRFPFRWEELPKDGIYFFYEEGETVDHGDGHRPRIVRIGTHKDGNFRPRMSDHYLLRGEERKMAFTAARPAPKDRSIFRKNLGRALLHRDGDAYLDVWNIDFTTRATKAAHAHRRDIGKEQRLEADITAILRGRFSFRFIVLEGPGRMGSGGLESRLIGTVAQCPSCVGSDAWLGRSSPKPEIADSGLWLSQHLDAPALTPDEERTLTQAIDETLARVAQ